MFTERTLEGELPDVRAEYAPDALVLNCQRDFETLDSAVAEELLLVTDSVDPLSYDSSWVPENAPDPLRRFAGSDLTIGMPGDGGVAWTHQTGPPCVFVKPRLETSPSAFVDFLVAEALVEVGLDEPEHFLGFFGERYPEFARVTDPRLGPADTYQLATALYDAYLGIQTRAEFSGWAEDYPDLYDAWADAGERLEPRLSDLAGEIARGQTGFAAAAELACSGVKHGLDLPAPFAALDTEAYREYGADYAIQWVETTFEKLD
ncbi:MULTISPECIES: DUF7089 family protein [Haloarcula]|uniref:Uncharacterized protein n=1 Tax=Haloarcula pellucida TaxID=1427151 RepID=A0A830GQW0_9EURY|nr:MULTISPECIES: hypothetical protein [Halomicroarcula]MBX0349369.1 hypothetical protein [Halomicroarcula pellucida]MDS0279045.1 hypothetical protein [Halomicroarcula sp. S1AR25-4]GGO03277.1 hypothetical protein GCM10009030_38760 [Halomicroarcula pellucida]